MVNSVKHQFSASGLALIAHIFDAPDGDPFCTDVLVGQMSPQHCEPRPAHEDEEGIPEDCQFR